MARPERRDLLAAGMEIHVAIGGGQKMTLTGAILVYQGGHEAFAAWHAAKAPEDGAAP